MKAWGFHEIKKSQLLCPACIDVHGQAHNTIVDSSLTVRGDFNVAGDFQGRGDPVSTVGKPISIAFRCGDRPKLYIPARGVRVRKAAFGRDLVGGI